MKVLKNISLKKHTTFKIGGPARYFISVSSVAELVEALRFARENNLPFAALGGGSNVLVSDEGFPGAVIKNEIRGIIWKETNNSAPANASADGQETITKVRVGAGESWDNFVKQTVERGLWGLENLSGIPGTVGGAPVQNIGAYGAEIKDTIESVEAIDAATGKVKTLSNAECDFSYRDSIFKKPAGKKLVIARVTFRLRREGKPNLEYNDLKERFLITASADLPARGAQAGASAGEQDSRFKYGKGKRMGATPASADLGTPLDKVGATFVSGHGGTPTLRDIRKAVLEIRRKKFPDLTQCGTAGSFFKNPIIPQAQFDELRRGYPDLPGFPLLSAFRLPPSVKVPLAWILDRICGLKGLRKDGLALFERQPVVLVKLGQASAKEVAAFAEEVVALVKEKTGIKIEWEVQRL